jgi:hypothetical protein
MLAPHSRALDTMFDPNISSRRFAVGTRVLALCFVSLSTTSALAQPAPQSDVERGEADLDIEAQSPPRASSTSPTEIPVELPVELPPRAPEKIYEDGFRDRFVLESGRVPFIPPNHEFLSFGLHGEYQLRFRALSDLPLEKPVRDQSDEAGLLGQNAYLYHWLRLRGRIDVDDFLSFVGEIDLPRGLFVGDATRYVTADRDPLDEARFYEVHPRQAYVEYRSPIGTFRLGQQTGHWGLGLLANDGDHEQMFGDTSRGTLTERLLFATTPLGKNTPLIIVVAGDLVFEDNTADLIDGDIAAQAVAAVLYREDAWEIGAYGVFRHQQRDTSSTTLTPFTEKLDVGVVDIAGKVRIPFAPIDVFAYVQGEAAVIFGGTSFLRSGYGNALDPTKERDREKVLSFGTAITAGFVHTTSVAGVNKNDAAKPARPRPDETSAAIWGDVVAEIELGYASGDADPYDGETHRFTFDSNHNVGLVLFDHVMAWKTARAATIAQDSRVVGRANPGLQFLPSKGGVFGATYLNPRIVVRPRPWVDVKLGFVFAQASADVVDPYHAGALGNYANYDGGDPTRRDLGIEVDTGALFRIPVTSTTRFEVGAEGGVLMPGHAFDDANNVRLPTQYLLNTRVGLQF